jgi:hypothetical protein
MLTRLRPSWRRRHDLPLRVLTALVVVMAVSSVALFLPGHMPTISGQTIVVLPGAAQPQTGNPPTQTSTPGGPVAAPAGATTALAGAVLQADCGSCGVTLVASDNLQYTKSTASDGSVTYTFYGGNGGSNVTVCKGSGNCKTFKVGMPQGTISITITPSGAVTACAPAGNTSCQTF